MVGVLSYRKATLLHTPLKHAGRLIYIYITMAIKTRKQLHAGKVTTVAR